MKRIGQGRTADIYEFGNQKVLKLFHQEFPEASVEYEYITSQFVYSLGIRTPRPYDLVEHEDRRGIVMERVSGVSMLKLITSKPWLVNQMISGLAELHVDVHKRNALGLKKQKEVLRGNIERAPLSAEEKKKVLEHLEGLREGHSLCHGDFHPDNVLEGEWLIDWMDGVSGNPAGDVARTVLLLSIGSMPEGTNKVLEIPGRLVRKAIKSRYLHRYLKLSGMDYAEVQEWILPVAAARLVENIPEAEKNILLEIVSRGEYFE